jgi:hypothetical protein
LTAGDLAFIAKLYTATSNPQAPTTLTYLTASPSPVQMYGPGTWWTVVRRHGEHSQGSTDRGLEIKGAEVVITKIDLPTEFGSSLKSGEPLI